MCSTTRSTTSGSAAHRKIWTRSRTGPTASPGECTRVPGLRPRTSIYSILTMAMHRWRSSSWGLPVARRQTRRCLRVLRGRYQGRGTAPVLLERRQFGERAHPYGHVHRQHRAAPRHGWRTAGQGSGRDRTGGIHHAKQWRLDHVRQTPDLTAGHTGDHRLAAITLTP